MRPPRSLARADKQPVAPGESLAASGLSRGVDDVGVFWGDGGFLDMSVAGEKLAVSENRSKLGAGCDVVRCLGVWVSVNLSWVV
jgi:hypothetical protein